eukprot:610931-Amphidinium_carterae.1
MYGGESTDSNAVLCVASDPPPEPIWGAFKQLLQVRPSLDAFRQLMTTMKADRGCDQGCGSPDGEES